MNKSLRLKPILLFLIAVAALTSFPLDSLAEEAESVDLESVKSQYWTRGEKAKMGVVQNRQYSKSGSLQVGLLGGLVSSDPFLNTEAAGLMVTYHSSEYYSLGIVGWKSFVGPSNALLTFEANKNATANTNHQKWYLGAEGTASLLYGKLSLLGYSIVYYDLHLLGGIGVTATESGNYITPSLGIGQRFYLSKRLSLRIDYRLMIYREDILEKEITTKIGQVVDTRTNFSNNIMLGIDFSFGGY